MVSITNGDHTIAGQNPVKLKSKLRLLRQTNAPVVSQRLDSNDAAISDTLCASGDRNMISSAKWDKIASMSWRFHASSHCPAKV